MAVQTPKEIVAVLDEYIIGQNEPRRLSVSLSIIGTEECSFLKSYNRKLHRRIS